jgi:hypothetical protein
MRFVAAPLIMIAGFLLMKYPVQTTRITGQIGFAERYFGSFGGTYAWWRIVGVAMVIFGLLWLTGVVHYNNNSSLQLPGVEHQDVGPIQ